MATFTKVLINPARRKGREYLTNPHKLHAAVMSAFPPDMDTTAERVLWRLDERGHEHILYLVGPEKPTASHIVEEAGWDVRPQQTADYNRLLAQLIKGQKWAFELVANPTRTVPVKGGKRGKVVAHVGANNQLSWLHDKADFMGVSFGDRSESTAQVVGSRNLDFYRTRLNGEKGQRVHIVTARFKGELEVVDPEKLRFALLNGVGRGKGYGCGLLTLARRG
ncbi:type I-E CRISPR-associated protein Cas6/Cse3/CasE [Corynebacterium hindlerae]|uniref:Type I-E CRISPR-associated protein Cas6/Cse3/CasE n=1 Tax=Corynebacterium hindlerae TaxID=699041 RepID=A0A7G5FCW7_9CORY|nr:type I-E CRISPR-associated protein Cas6/Cse3/CasE [Corynebacterium hindlerae]QMV84458.1 type I-E CRISPR-associated protein Cas6/Cse3/CasE [Corynebacterium hindlerae]QTH59634.1 type I-E CRISPR-associated protein Cas6/Cse3/CasE [Corynebacterium hindlerae]